MKNTQEELLKEIERQKYVIELMEKIMANQGKMIALLEDQVVYCQPRKTI